MIKAAVKRWWQGRYVEPENDPHSGVVFVMGWYERHWTARACRAVLGFFGREWRWLIPVTLSGIGLFLTYLRFF